jgi:hypothetical protein
LEWPLSRTPVCLLFEQDKTKFLSFHFWRLSTFRGQVRHLVG